MCIFRFTVMVSQFIGQDVRFYLSRASFWFADPINRSQIPPSFRAILQLVLVHRRTTGANRRKPVDMGTMREPMEATPARQQFKTARRFVYSCTLACFTRVLNTFAYVPLVYCIGYFLCDNYICIYILSSGVRLFTTNVFLSI